MNSELKKEFGMRISQANNVEMIIIGYEMTETYISDAFNADYEINLDMAKRCIEEMMNNLHYEYELASSLKQLYLYMKKRLRDARFDGDREAAEEVLKMITGLKESYMKIASEDASESVMKNAQSVVVGMTYGKNQTLEEMSDSAIGRGFRA